MNEKRWDENDMTDEELLRMWDEGEPVAILQTRVEVQLPHAYRPDSVTRGGGEGRSRNLRLGSSTTRDLAPRESVNTGAAAA